MKTMACIAGALLAMIISITAHAQTILQPIRHPVYEFLDRVEAKYQHGLASFVRPLARIDIARHLDLLRRESGLTSHDAEELAYYAEEFHEELRRLHGEDTLVVVPTSRRWHLAQLATEGPFDGWLGFDFVAKGGYALRQDADNVMERHAGIAATGYAAGSIGFGMVWTDNARRGEVFDVHAYRTPEQGVVPGPGTPTDYQYEIAEGQFTWSNPWIRIGVDKLDRWQGSGRDGAIILSDKAPSFPALSLQVRITSWIHLDYSHGWLFSDSLDIDRTQPYYAGFERQKIYAGKYFATHSLTLRPSRVLQLAFGESIIYSDQPHPLFFIPVISFRAADRWTHASMGNSQFFADLRCTPMRGLTLYGTGYIDELDASKIFSDNKAGFDYHIAYTAGALAADVHAAWTGIASETRIEYSRTYPYVYTNPKITQQYTSHQVVLGHWIGANADILTLEHTLHPLRSLELRATASYLRFGEGREFLSMTFGRIQPAFLYGYEYSAFMLTGRATWRPWHDLSVTGLLSHTSVARQPAYTGATFVPGTHVALAAAYGIF